MQRAEAAGLDEVGLPLSTLFVQILLDPDI